MYTNIIYIHIYIHILCLIVKMISMGFGIWGKAYFQTTQMLIPLDVTMDSFRWRPAPAPGGTCAAAIPNNPPSTGSLPCSASSSAACHPNNQGSKFWPHPRTTTTTTTTSSSGARPMGPPPLKLHLARCTPQTHSHLEVLGRLCSGSSIGHLTRSLQVPPPQDLDI